MNLEYVPLIPVMRELHGLPRGRERFRQYLRTIFPLDDSADQLLPLLAMNPMGKDHVTALLDTLLAMDADGIGARATAEASAQLTDLSADFKVGVVIADDLLGGWTNRYADEFTYRFGPDHIRSRTGPPKRPRWLKDFWIMGVLWSSEAATEQAVRQAVLTAVYRVAYAHQHGAARTLRDMLAQEGHVMARAGCAEPVLEAEDIAYTRAVLAAYLDAEDMRTCIECLFGDAAGRTLGFTPRGLSPWAGLALALHNARANQTAWQARQA
jgi:hypothetical protein